LVEDGVAVGWTAWEMPDPTAGSWMVSDALDRWADPDAVAVRFVHGGSAKGPVLMGDSEFATLQRLAPLAPVHQPLSLAIAAEVYRLRPDVPLVACFDTVFHAELPEAAAHYPLPRAWTRQNRLRRYGFHGLSCRYAVGRTAEILGESESALQVVCCHLGAGVSVTAVRHGASVDTSMGFTPLEGAAMATRSGSVDPGLLLHVMKSAPMTVDEMSDALYHRSGLAGMSGTNGDLRNVLAAVAAGSGDAELALAVYVHRLRREIGAAAMSLDRLDAVVFTGGVAEYQPELIDSVISGLSVLGLGPAGASHQGVGDRVITAEGTDVAALIVVPREDLELARGAEEALVRARSVSRPVRHDLRRNTAGEAG
jgi:acetate kinase